MIIAVVSAKGGSGKTTTAMHLADYFQTLAPTVLLDGDGTTYAINWNSRGEGLPFAVRPIAEAEAVIHQYTHTVIDTGQRPSMDDLRTAYAVCDLIVIPTNPGGNDEDSCGQTINDLREIGPDKFKVLLTKVEPDEAAEAAQLRSDLAAAEVPVFTAELPKLKAYKKASKQGKTARQVADRNSKRAWAAVVAVGQEITA